MNPDPPQFFSDPDSEEGRVSGGDLPPVGSPPRSDPVKASKQERKQFRRDINRTPKQGDSIDGSSCLTMLLFPSLLMFLLVFVLGHIGLAVLLP